MHWYCNNVGCPEGEVPNDPYNVSCFPYDPYCKNYYARITETHYCEECKTNFELDSDSNSCIFSCPDSKIPNP